MRKLALVALAIGICGSPAFARDAQVQGPAGGQTRNGPYYTDSFGGGFGYRPNLALSIGINNVNADFSGIGTASDSLIVLCAETDFYDVALRYAGEFSGFRVAAFGSACTGLNTASDPLGGGIDGRVDVNAILGAGFRFSGPQFRTLIGPSRIYGEIGVSVSHVKIEAAPFESGRGWVSGVFLGIGAEMCAPWGAGVSQNIDACATTLYLNYRHYENSGLTISGGGASRNVDTDFDIFSAGSRIKF